MTPSVSETDHPPVGVTFSLSACTLFRSACACSPISCVALKVDGALRGQGEPCEALPGMSAGENPAYVSSDRMDEAVHVLATIFEPPHIFFRSPSLGPPRPSNPMVEPAKTLDESAVVGRRDPEG